MLFDILLEFAEALFITNNSKKFEKLVLRSCAVIGIIALLFVILGHVFDDLIAGNDVALSALITSSLLIFTIKVCSAISSSFRVKK